MPSWVWVFAAGPWVHFPNKRLRKMSLQARTRDLSSRGHSFLLSVSCSRLSKGQGIISKQTTVTGDRKELVHVRPRHREVPFTYFENVNGRALLCQDLTFSTSNLFCSTSWLVFPFFFWVLQEIGREKDSDSPSLPSGTTLSLYLCAGGPIWNRKGEYTQIPYGEDFPQMGRPFLCQ